MAEVIVSAVYEQLTSILQQHFGEDELSRVIVDRDTEFLRKFENNILGILAVLDDVQNGRLRGTRVGIWLNHLKQTCEKFYDIDDALDEWGTAKQKLQAKGVENAFKPTRMVCFFISSYLFTITRAVLLKDIAYKIKDLNETLDNIAKENEFLMIIDDSAQPKRPMTTFVFDPSEFHERDQDKIDERYPDKKTIVNFLLSESSHGPTLPIISIVGLEGIGKSTLARLVFDDKEVTTRFDTRIWVSTSYPFDEIRIAKAILKSLNEDASDLVELETVLQHIRQCIKRKKFLLILDDVETKDLTYWEQLNYSLKCGSPGSRILVTTHDGSVVEKIGSNLRIPLGILSEEDCWSLFCEVASFERTTEESKTMEYIGKKIISKCMGLPLAVKILGALLRFKRNIEEWQNILDSELWKLAHERGLFAPLLLSYDDLPSVLRKCFSYCAIFPKDYMIEKNRLIKLWMSQGYLKIKGQEDMESVGEEYFENLITRCFFKDFQRNEDDGSIISCKIHSVILDSARLLMKSEHFTLKVDTFENFQLVSSEKTRHLMIEFEKKDSSPIYIYNEKKLRSLVVESKGGFISYVALSKLFDQLTCLRTLDLSNRDNVWYQSIKEVPRGIKKLIHLRYLNLSGNQKMKQLPETLCELYNLETLELNWCINLKFLPQGMGKLINLRHIVNDGTSLSHMPKGVERLTRLRTLTEFVVSCAGDDSKACIESLGKLNHLRSLRIRKLGNVIDANEVEKAELKNKENLLDLHLNFQKDEEKGRTNEDDEEALKNLQPPPNLERLEISYYRGLEKSYHRGLEKSYYRGSIIFSSWIMSLSKLRLMTLDSCKNFEHLPPLGKLTSLESLIVRRMKSVKRVGHEFLGIEDDGISLSSPVVAFPKLKYLQFQKMKEWKEWNYEFARMTEGDTEIMPCLCSLTIGFCPKLETLPDYISQRATQPELKIISCPTLEDCHKKRTGDGWHKIPNIKFCHDWSSTIQDSC